MSHSLKYGPYIQFLRSQIIVSLHITYYDLTNDLEINGNLAYKRHELSFKFCYIVAAFRS